MIEILENIPNYISTALARALKVSFESDYKIPMGAVTISPNRKILSVSSNRMKTHPLQEQFKPRESAIWLHAEISALVRNKFSNENCELLVARWRRDNKLGYSRPCCGCARAMLDAGISYCYYIDKSHRLVKAKISQEFIDGCKI